VKSFRTRREGLHHSNRPASGVEPSDGFLESAKENIADRAALHPGNATAIPLGDAAFGYVNAFTAHVNVGFFRGAEIADPDRLLEGTGRFMRHVKLRPGRSLDARALTKLIDTAYAADMKRRVEAE
jgi:hypothetical protein